MENVENSTLYRTGDMIVATATESTVGANHDIMMQGDRKNDLISQEVTNYK